MPTIKTGRDRQKTSGPFRSNALPELIAEAKKTGNVGTLRELFRNLNASNFRMDVVDVVFHHLQQKWIVSPNLFLDLNSKEKQHLDDFIVERALTGAFCTSKAITRLLLLAPPHMVDRVVEVVVAHLDDYFAWAKYLASHCAPVQDSQQGARLSDPTMQCRALLCMLEEPDRRLPEALLNSNLLIEYSIAAWIAVNPLTCGPYLSFDRNHICPIMSLFAKLILSKITQQKVIDVLYAPGSKSRKLRMEVIRATISRCATIAQLGREAADKMVARVPLAKVAGRLMTGVEAVVCCMETILQVVRGLSIVSDMSEGFLRSTFYGELAQAYHTWRLHL
ncbi:hypothetical protein FA13DRAFT_199735 [Coprinellus micaceus]|uniref:Uncharacterized protein n=1 Tax=Coprinellus micaceus TaxID=71717 RepID=A0A4Y7TGN9_COPMI|nr:hypothetical protein FA13DRAFT_199735 [Coprinellus micaceus]